jgi:hypothetical protein
LENHVGHISKVKRSTIRASVTVLTLMKPLRVKALTALLEDEAIRQRVVLGVVRRVHLRQVITEVVSEVSSVVIERERHRLGLRRLGVGERQRGGGLARWCGEESLTRREVTALGNIALLRIRLDSVVAVAVTHPLDEGGSIGLLGRTHEVSEDSNLHTSATVTTDTLCRDGLDAERRTVVHEGEPPLTVNVLWDVEVRPVKADDVRARTLDVCITRPTVGDVCASAGHILVHHLVRTKGDTRLGRHAMPAAVATVTASVDLDAVGLEHHDVARVTTGLVPVATAAPTTVAGRWKQ